MYIRCDCVLNDTILPGETSSGKSTLLNLILGEQLLPYSVLSTTSTICELKYGPSPKLVAHFKDKDPQTGLSKKTVRLRESSQQSNLKEISSFVHVKTDRDKGSDYKKIELFWPHNLLKVGYESRYQKISSKRRHLVLVGVITCSLYIVLWLCSLNLSTQSNKMFLFCSIYC